MDVSVVFIGIVLSLFILCVGLACILDTNPGMIGQTYRHFDSGNETNNLLGLEFAISSVLNKPACEFSGSPTLDHGFGSLALNQSIHLQFLAVR